MTNDFLFADLSPAWKLVITGFLVVLGSGYLAAALNARLAVGLSPAAIADHYGDRSISGEERAAIEERGFVEEEFSLESEPEHAEEAHIGHVPEAMTGGRSLSAQELAQLAHIHWLGFSFILLSVGGLVALSTLSQTSKVALILTLALSLFLDIASLILVRFVVGGFAWLTMATGTLIGVCILLAASRVLWELWFMSRPTRVS